jgi:hypothetical protein
VKYRKRQPLSARDIQLLILIAVVSVAVFGMLIGADIQVSRNVPGGGGFFAPWVGAREFLFNHLSPYGAQVQKLTDETVYGGAAPTGERPSHLTIPFFLMIVYFPMAFLADPGPQRGALAVLNAFSNPSTARGIWLFLNEAALVGTALLTLRLIEWQPRRLFQVAYALLSVFGFYSVIALIDGGPAVLLGLASVAVLFTYANEEDELAGALLVLMLFAWEITVFFVLLMLWKSLYDKRRRILAGFGMMLLLLLMISFIIYPGWILPYVRLTLEVLRSSYGMTSAAVLSRLWPVYGARAAQALTLVVIILMFYEWSATRHADSRRFMWAACFTLAATPLIGFRTELANLVVLLPCLASIFAGVANRWRAGYWLAGLLLLIVFLVPWAWFTRWLVQQDQRWQDYLLLFLPLFTVVGLYWTRWWFVRPPRTWYDHVRGTLSATQRIAESRRSPNGTG